MEISCERGIVSVLSDRGSALSKTSCPHFLGTFMGIKVEFVIY